MKPLEEARAWLTKKRDELLKEMEAKTEEEKRKGKDIEAKPESNSLFLDAIANFVVQAVTAFLLNRKATDAFAGGRRDHGPLSCWRSATAANEPADGHLRNLSQSMLA